uniref:hypothetical protein n=1 Tax=Brucella intermedia TaxID=94625 RepID=UPI00224AD106
HPESDAAALSQTCLILSLNGDPIFLFGDLMPMSSIMFEGHGQDPEQAKTNLYHPTLYDY